MKVFYEKQAYQNYPVIVPTNDILGDFAGFTEQALSMIEVNHAENRSLAALRDTLLPRLMSGDLLVETRHALSLQFSA